MSDASPPDQINDQDLVKRRTSVRLTTVYGGRISQFGKAYACTISDLSVGGAKVKLKDPDDFSKLLQGRPAQLVFERLTDYKSLNGDVAWSKTQECVVGLTFTDPELRRRLVLKRLMPNRWRIANEQGNAETAGQRDAADDGAISQSNE